MEGRKEGRKEGSDELAVIGRHWEREWWCRLGWERSIDFVSK